MGTTQAHGMADAVDDGTIDLHTAVDYHLTANHYPPVPRPMIDVAVAAIELANAEAWDDDVDLPDGVSWRGQDTVPVHAIVEEFHLIAFVGV